MDRGRPGGAIAPVRRGDHGRSVSATSGGGSAHTEPAGGGGRRDLGERFVDRRRAASRVARERLPPRRMERQRTPSSATRSCSTSIHRTSTVACHRSCHAPDPGRATTTGGGRTSLRGAPEPGRPAPPPWSRADRWQDGPSPEPPSRTGNTGSRLCAPGGPAARNRGAPLDAAQRHQHNGHRGPPRLERKPPTEGPPPPTTAGLPDDPLYAGQAGAGASGPGASRRPARAGRSAASDADGLGLGDLSAGALAAYRRI